MLLLLSLLSRSHGQLLLIALVLVLLHEVNGQSETSTTEATSTTFDASTVTTDEGSTQDTNPPDTDPPVVSSTSTSTTKTTTTTTTTATTTTTTTTSTTTSPVVTAVTLPSMSCCTPQQLGEVIQIILELLALEGIIPGLNPTTPLPSPSANSTMDYNGPPAVPGGPHDSNRPGGPHDSNRPGGPHDSNRPGGPHDSNRPGGPHDSNRPQGDNRPISGFDSQYPYIPLHFGGSSSFLSGDYFGVSGMRDHDNRGNDNRENDDRVNHPEDKPKKDHEQKKDPSKVPTVPSGSRRSGSLPLSPKTISLSRVGKNKKDVSWKVKVEKSKWRNKFKLSLGKRNIVLSKKEILTLIQNSYARSFDWHRTKNNKFLYKCKIFKKCKRSNIPYKGRNGKKFKPSKKTSKPKKIKRNKKVTPKKVSDRSSNSVINWLKKLTG